MQQLKHAITQMIIASPSELNELCDQCFHRTFKRQECVSQLGAIPNEVFFIEQGLIRVLITDPQGTEHTIHFALENQFIVDYSNFILKQPSYYTLQALELTRVTVMPRSAIEWGYSYLTEGQKLGRLIAEFYYIYQDDRIKNTYARTPKQRYNSITDVFPNIHNRVPQHMIASYLGISPVHLSRLKKAEILRS